MIRVALECDDCRRQFLAVPSKRDLTPLIRSEAKASGWLHIKKRNADYCPTCRGAYEAKK